MRPHPGMELWRPDWFKVYGSSFAVDHRANDLVSVTRETARVALEAVYKVSEKDYYQNAGIAMRELKKVLED